MPMKCPHCSEEVTDAVPIARVNEKAARISELEGLLSDAETRVHGVERVERQLERVKQQLADAQAAHEAYRTDSETSAAMLRAGITDPEDMELARWRHGKTEGAPDFATWLVNDAPKDRYLSALFETGGQSDAPPPEQTDRQPAAPTRVAPRESAGVKREQPSPPPQYTVADVQSMSIEQLKAARKAGHV